MEEGHRSVSVRLTECVRKTPPNIPVLQLKRDDEPRRTRKAGDPSKLGKVRESFFRASGEAQHLRFMPGSLTLDF